MEWIRSSACGTDHVTEQCVEASVQADGWVKVRDSKEPDSRWLLFSPDEWSAFVEGVKAGEFDFTP